MESIDPGRAAQAVGDLHGWASAVLLTWLALGLLWLVVRAPRKLILAVVIVFGPLVYANREQVARDPASVVEAPFERVGRQLSTQLEEGASPG